MTADAPLPAPGIDALGRFVGRREIAALRPALAEGERVVYALQGFHGARRGLLAATDRRVVWVRQGWFRARVRSFPYEGLQRVAVGLDADEAVVTLSAPRGDFLVARCNRLAAHEFGTRAADAARRGASTFRLVLADPEAPTLTATLKSVEVRLERLDRMLARRSLTPDEHRVARRRLLESVGLPTDLPDERGQVSDGGRAAVRGDPEGSLARADAEGAAGKRRRSYVKRL